MSPSPSSAATVAQVPGAHVGKRMLALLYDLMPALSLWFLVASLFLLGYLVAGRAPEEYVQPWSMMMWLLWLACWLVTGAYATISWRRGGQTLGMRPWRIRVVAADGSPPSWSALCRRYVVATLSLAAGGLGFWWAWLDRERLTWHDRAAGTRMVHERRMKK